MSEGEAKQLIDNEITEEEVLIAARRAFTFLSTCVEGQVKNATVGNRIMAARSLLEHAARVPRLLNELVASADQLSDEDLELIESTLE